MARPKKVVKKTVKQQEPVTETKPALSNFYANRLDQVEKKFNLISQELSIPWRLSTGNLCIDLMSGGGLVPGSMAQVSGLEKGAKSTTCLTTLGSAIRHKIPIINYWDSENALDPVYTQAVTKHPIASIFFGNERMARLYQEGVIETFFNQTRLLLRNIPDKIYNPRLKQFFYVFESDQAGRKMMSDFGFSSYEKSLYQQTGQLWCPTDNMTMQGITFVDSYPGLVSQFQDDQDEKSNQMALDARAFSQNIKRVVGHLKKKSFMIFGVNQIRQKPGVTYGSPNYEPGGEALKFFSSLRFQNMPRAVPSGWPQGMTQDGKATSGFGQENSVINPSKVDKYNYIYMTNTKNKFGTPGLSCFQRVWFSDHQNKPQGYDPVFDTYAYLKMTGRVSGKRNKWVFDHPLLPKREWTWAHFKTLILMETHGSKNKEFLAQGLKALKLSKPILLRKALFQEMKTTVISDLLVQSSHVDED